MSETGSVAIEHSDGVARIVFTHPKANSLPASLLDALIDSFRQATALPEVRVILLESEGSTFCAGASFEEFEKLSSLEEAESFFARFATLFLVLKQCPKWVIAKVQGKAVGGGVGLVAAADYSVGAPEVAVRLSEYALDIGPYVIGPIIERRIGVAAFSSMALDCEWRDSNWCVQRGLLDVVADSREALDTHCDELLVTLAARSALATTTLKSCSWEQTEHWQQLLYVRARMSAELLIAKKTKESKE